MRLEHIVCQSLQFHDVNEEYEEAQRINLATEMKVMSSKKDGFIQTKISEEEFDTPEIYLSPKRKDNPPNSTQIICSGVELAG